MIPLHFAPVQGHTDAAYRHFHSLVYGNDQTYYTPFIRLEKDSIRPRDLKDLNSDLNSNLNLVPQIIFRDGNELRKLIEILIKDGKKRIDLNLGCPFPLQTGHGRGAAAISNLSLAEDIVKCINENPEIIFSVKMRLGLNEPDEWKKILPYLNSVKLNHITMHPRTAKQQYGGELNLNQFSEFLSLSKNPVVYNGDITTPEGMRDVLNRFSEIKGIMVARGILGRPSLFKEFLENKDWAKEERISKLLEFHKLLFQHYSEVLCGDSQIISKIKPFWEYCEEEIGRKAWKAIKKSVNLSKYQTAVAMI